MSDALVGGHDTEPPTPSHEMRLDEGTASTLDAWIRSMSRPAPTTVGRLPSHSPTCAGCGTENPAGLALKVDATEVGVRAVHRFDHRQEGAPGITHGGLVAAAFDDLFGFKRVFHKRALGSKFTLRNMMKDKRLILWDDFRSVQ